VAFHRVDYDLWALSAALTSWAGRRSPVRG
jgi:hypothetical protein